LVVYIVGIRVVQLCGVLRQDRVSVLVRCQRVVQELIQRDRLRLRPHHRGPQLAPLTCRH
jgi:hypothetical protein